MAGAPPGGGAPFDLSALSSVLNDPAIRGMAESIAQDPTFAQLTATLQESLLGGGAGAGGAAAGAAAGAGDGLPAGLDPSKYAEAMSSVMGNPGFMQMAESLGKQIMEVGKRRRDWGRMGGRRRGGAATGGHAAPFRHGRRASGVPMPRGARPDAGAAGRRQTARDRRPADANVVATATAPHPAPAPALPPPAVRPRHGVSHAVDAQPGRASQHRVQAGRAQG